MKITKKNTLISIAVSVLTIDFLIRVYNDLFVRFSLQDTYNFFGIIAAIASPITAYFIIRTFQEQRKNSDADLYLKEFKEIKKVTSEFRKALGNLRKLETDFDNLKDSLILDNIGILSYTLILFLIALDYFEKKDKSKAKLFCWLYNYKNHYIDLNQDFLSLKIFLENYVDLIKVNDPKVIDSLNDVIKRDKKINKSLEDLNVFYEKYYN